MYKVSNNGDYLEVQVVALAQASGTIYDPTKNPRLTSPFILTPSTAVETKTNTCLIIPNTPRYAGGTAYRSSRISTGRHRIQGWVNSTQTREVMVTVAIMDQPGFIWRLTLLDQVRWTLVLVIGIDTISKDEVSPTLHFGMRSPDCVLLQLAGLFLCEIINICNPNETELVGSDYVDHWTPTFTDQIPENFRLQVLGCLASIKAEFRTQLR